MSIGLLMRLDQAGVSPLRLDARRIRIGRAQACELCLNDRNLSREHASIESRPEGYVLVDHNSRNGTRVNGIAICRRLLRDGDRIAIGNVELVFNLADELAAPEQPAIDSLPARSAADGIIPDGATICQPASERRKRGSDPTLHGWQIMRAFNAAHAHQTGAVAEQVVSDLAGLCNVRRVVLYLAPGVCGHTERWIKRGDPRSRSGTPFSEDLLRAVAAGDTPVRDRGAGAAEADDAACHAVLMAGRPRGALYVEGTEPLDPEPMDVVRLAAEALGMGLALHATSSARATAIPAAPSAEIIGRSKALQACMATTMRAARTDATILLRGESGTGKELFARLIVGESPRRDGPFIPVHSSAIEENLLGSTLFGHEKGAFTGAVTARRGLFEDADGGTIFLDEIGELSLVMQVKLLRVLQEQEFMRVGGNKQIKVDVRVIAATNRDLEAAVKEGAFREDLYFRLKVIEVRLPALRARTEDIPDLVDFFVGDLRRSVATDVRRVSPEAMQALCTYPWPGNVREVRNVVERCLVLTSGPELKLDDLPPEIIMACAPCEPAAEVLESPAGDLRGVEHHHIRRVLQECAGNKKLAAERLGISRTTLYEKLRNPAEF
ncbi:MAG: sigma 54-interacting transcriptional regulator [Lentisphaerae bacterium]|nr:sigma 54-interacting transcriptional regulator [Lentisphaerota bacterium]